MTRDGSAPFYNGRVSTTTGTAFVFISTRLLLALLTTLQVHSDATFKTVPELFYQMFTLHVLFNGRVMELYI